MAEFEKAATVSQQNDEVFHPQVYMSPSYPPLATYPLLR